MCSDGWNMFFINAHVSMYVCVYECMFNVNILISIILKATDFVFQKMYLNLANIHLVRAKLTFEITKCTCVLHT